MVAVTLLRGFRVSVATLDAFLAANGVEETFGTPPFTDEHPDNDAISVLLHSMLGPDADPHKMARVIIPQRNDMNRSTVAYVAYTWVMAFAHREIQLDADLPAEVPPAFEALRSDILKFGNAGVDVGRMGLFLVVTDSPRGNYNPEVLIKRMQVREL